MSKNCFCCILIENIKKNWKFMILAAIVLLFIGYNVYILNGMANNVQETMDGYEKAVQSIDNIETRLNDTDEDLMTEFYRLRLDWTNEKIELENTKGYVDREIFRIYIYACAIVLLGSLGIWNILKSLINKSVYQHISDLTQENREIVKKIIKNNKKEQKLTKEKNILMLAQEKKNNDNIEIFLRSMGFENIISKTISELNDYSGNYDDFHLVFLNNQCGNIAKEKGILEEKGNELVRKCGKEKIYFYYREGVMLDFPYIGFNIEINYSNSKFTLYRNLIDTLMISENIEFLKRATAES